MHLDFDGKTALISGGTRGIGAAIVKQLLASGAKVIALGSSEASIAQAATQNPSVRYYSVDLKNPAAIETLVASLQNTAIDILVNNAGINRINSVHDISLSDWDDIQHINSRAPFLLSRDLAPKMAARNYGRIVNIASIFGHVTRAKRAAYTTSKAALIGFTKSLALDYAAQNVLVNAVGPGFIDTDMTREILSSDQRAALINQVPAHRLGTPEEIAQLITFLVSENNTFVTGQHVVADGGFTIT